MTQPIYLSGSIFGNYELRDMLGIGGMGSVYRARQLNLDRLVAVKVLTAALAQESDYLERFNREAKTAAGLEHPHIVPVYDYGAFQGMSYMVMRLLGGGTLGQRMRFTLEQRRTPSLKDVSFLLTQISSALDYAHGRGIVHRDIKPSNIMFDETGSAYLVDFGIAKLLETFTASMTSSNMMMGTPRYMSPEQWKGDPVSAASDIYALGGVIYEMVTGRALFEGTTPYALMSKHLNDMPTPIHHLRTEITPRVTQVIEKAMAKLPDQRFKSASLFAETFAAAISNTDALGTDFFKFSLPTQPVLPQLNLTPPPMTQATEPLLPGGTSPSNAPPTPGYTPGGSRFTPPGGTLPYTTPPRGTPPYTTPPSGTPLTRSGTIPTPVAPSRDRFTLIIAGLAIALVVVVAALFILLSQPDSPTPPERSATAVVALAGTQTDAAAAFAAVETQRALSATPTLTPSGIPTETFTPEPTETFTPTPSDTDAPSATPMFTATDAPTAPSLAVGDDAPSATMLSAQDRVATFAVQTVTRIGELTAVAVRSNTLTPSELPPTLTPSDVPPTATPTSTASDLPPTLTPSEVLLTALPTRTPNDMPTTNVRAVVETATLRPTEIASPSETPSRTSAPSATAILTATPTDTQTYTPSPTLTPTDTQTYTPSPTLTPTDTQTYTPSPTLTPTDTQTYTPSPTLTPTDTQTYTPSPTLTPTWTPTPTATNTPTETPTFTPTPSPCELADVDTSGIVDNSDVTAIEAAYETRSGDANYNAAYDFDGSGDIDLLDLNFVLDQQMQCVSTALCERADVNADLRVDDSDVDAVDAAYGLSEADADFDAAVDTNDDGEIGLIDLDFVLEQQSVCESVILSGR